MKANPVALGRIIAAVLVMIIMVLLALPGLARAQEAPPRCLGLADVLARLNENFGELPIWEGRTDTGQTVILTVSPAGEGWTVFAVRTDGQACFVASGVSWRPSPAAPVPGTEG